MNGGLDWQADIRPVLEALKEAIDRNRHGFAEGDEINVVLNREANDRAADLALSKLRGEGYIDGYRGAEGWSDCTLIDKGLQTVAGWPSRPGDDTYELLLAALAQRIEAAPNDEERSKWTKLRDGVGGVGREFVIEVLSNLATKGM